MAFLGKIKNAFNFREMYKLVRGELFKFVKSATCLVLVIFVMLFVIVTSLVYDPDGETNGVAEFLGGSLYADDYFSYLKDATYAEYIDNYEIETPLPDKSIEDEFTLELKQKFITQTTSEYYAALNPVAALTAPPAVGEEDGSETEKLTPLQEFTRYNFNFYNLFIGSGEVFSERADEIKALFKNNGTDALISVLKGETGGVRAQLFESDTKLKLLVGEELFAVLRDDAEKVKAVELLKEAYENEGAVDALVRYVSYFQPIHSHIYSRASSNFKSIADNLNRAKRFFYFAADNNYGVSIPDFIKYLILEYGEAYDELGEAIDLAAEARVQNGGEYTEETVKLVHDSYVKFRDLYKTARAMIVVSYNAGVNFLFFPSPGTGGGLISSFISPAPEVYQNFNSRHGRINEEMNTADGTISDNKDSLKNIFETAEGFYETLKIENLIFTNDSVDIAVRMQESLSVADASLEIAITKEIYDGDFAFIEDRIDELLILMTGLSKGGDNLYLYREIFYRDPLLSALDEGYKKDYAAPEEFFKNAQKLVIESNYVNEYFKKQNFSLIIDKENYTDDDVSNIYGLYNFLVIGTSKYSLRSDIAKIVFMLDNRESIGTLTTPLALTQGYGFVFFAFSILYLFLIIAGIVVGAGTIAGEHAAGTIKLLLIRPYKRWKFLMSKIIMAIIVMAVIFVVSFLLIWLIGGIFWGFGSDYKVLVMFNATNVLIMSQFQTAALMALFYFIECIIYMLIAVMVSTIFKSKSGAVAISMAIYFAANIMILTLSSKSWFKYVLFNNTNLFYYMSTGPTLNDMTLGFSVIVDIVYILLIMISTFWVFTKKDAN
jgi:ABC-type transport system involved in multi-copper enzyme maturation permease subunit